MILFWSFVYLVYGLSAVQSGNTPQKNAGGPSIPKHPVMCPFNGNEAENDPGQLTLEPRNIPQECDVIIYQNFSINTESQLDIDEGFLNQILATKKPVILELSHDESYNYWGPLLGPNKQYKETKVLRDFALAHHVSGILIGDAYPDDPTIQYDVNVGPNLPSYLRQLKGDSNLIIVLGIPCYGVLLKSTCAFNFAELNSIVDFYHVDSWGINYCIPGVFNGVVPVGKTEHGSNFLMGLEEISEIISETQVDKTKLIYSLELWPYEKDSLDDKSYHQVCTNNYTSSTWCIENSKSLFAKGVFVRQQNAGCSIIFVEYDDIQNECGCGAFIGTQNIVAGFRGGAVKPCKKFDVQSSTLT